MFDFDTGYDYGDPKHPDYADAMIDKAERERDEMRIDGTWAEFKKWQDRRAADGLTGMDLSLTEFRRQQAEDEAEGS